MRTVIIFMLPILVVAQYKQMEAHNKVPPGVNPQQYQPPPTGSGGAPVRTAPGVPPRNQQPPQNTAQQIPVQKDLPDPHHVPKNSEPIKYDRNRVLDATNVLNERSHIEEHMAVPIDTSKMTEAELQFHYFKMHDVNNDNKLDGLELAKSVMHEHGHGQNRVFSDLELTQIVDPILQNDDLNKDGRIDYSEYSRANGVAAAKNKAKRH